MKWKCNLTWEQELRRGAGRRAGAGRLLFCHVALQLPSPALERIFLQGVRDACYGSKITLGTDGALISIPTWQ